MRKEVFFAIIAGVSIGLIFAFGIFRVNKAVKDDSADTESEIKVAKSSETPLSEKSVSSLTLLRPSNMQVFGEDVIEITGVAQAESYLVTTGGTYDNVTKTKSDGSFSLNYELDPAINTLNITSVNSQNTRSNTKLEVLYSSDAPKTSSATGSANIDEKIEDKLEKAQKIAEFYKGTITDLTSEGLQLKTSSGEIKQVSFSTTTSFAKITKTTTKITKDDIAIGDYILALGYRKNGNLLDSFRILVTTPKELSEVKVFYGTVSNKTKTDMEISEQSTGNVTITIDNNTKTYKEDPENPQKIRFADIKDTDLVIGTYQTLKDENVARRIYIISTL